MKTILDSNNVSKYIFADDKPVNITANNIEVGDSANLDFIVGDMNTSNSTLVEGVTSPVDWIGGKYTYSGGVWAVVDGWVDPE